MQFRFDDDQLAVRDAVRSLCADHLALDAVAGREGKPAEPALWQALADLGVLGVLAGGPGSGLGMVEAALAFEVLGAHLVPGPVLWSTLAAPFVDGVAGGAVRVAGAEVDEVGGAVPEPLVPEPLVPEPLVVDHGAEADTIVLVHADRIVACPAGALPPVAEGAPLDPLTPVLVLTAVPDGRRIGDAEAAHRVRRSGRVLAAAMLVGAAQGALDVARAYAAERQQFGVPIGSFQAVKHLLADMYVRLELARAALYAAAATAADPGAGDPDRAASAAKLLAGEAGVANGRTAVQVLGGMGFTWDMLPHYFLKRSWVLEHAFGTAPWHAAGLGRALGEEVAAS